MRKFPYACMFAAFVVMLSAALTSSRAYADFTPKTVSKLVAHVDDRNPIFVGRIPLILIHGIHGTASDWFGSINGNTDDEKEYFLNFMDYFYSSTLKDKYQLYRFHYLSDELPVKDIGQGLQEWLDDFIQKGMLNDVPLVIVAHSMGGLVARSYMQEHKHDVGSYSDEFGGERVLKLLTKGLSH